jgi:carbonic anhydrase
MNRTSGLLLTLLLILTPLSAQDHKDEFDHPLVSYSGDTGPGFWPETSPGCAASPRQSPIDLDHATPDATLAPLDLKLHPTPYQLTNSGYTVVATPPAGSGTLTLNGVLFYLLQFHFHTLSEHTVEGRRGVMELHAVFRNSHHNLVVIGVLYKLGAPDPFLQSLLTAGLPAKSTAPPVPVASLNLSQAFPGLASYFTYPGSLTTPPCSETVTWIVLKPWAELSPEQFESFRRILGNDFRPIQPTAGRTLRATVH